MSRALTRATVRRVGGVIERDRTTTFKLLVLGEAGSGNTWLLAAGTPIALCRPGRSSVGRGRADPSHRLLTWRARGPWGSYGGMKVVGDGAAIQQWS